MSVCRELLTGSLKKELFGHAGDGQPKLTVEEYSTLCSKLATVVSSLEQNIKTLLKDYDGKKKVLPLTVQRVVTPIPPATERSQAGQN